MDRTREKNSAGTEQAGVGTGAARESGRRKRKGQRKSNYKGQKKKAAKAAKRVKK